MKTQDIPSRRFAGIFDFPVDVGDTSTHGVDFSNDAIDGCYGIGWWKYFRDAQTAELYRVHCSDGVNGGKLAYSDEDDTYRQKCFRAIIDRHHKLADSRVAFIPMSRNELALMQGYTHCRWLETVAGKCDGQQSKKCFDGGLVGYCHGIQVVCLLEKKDDLPPRD